MPDYTAIHRPRRVYYSGFTSHVLLAEAVVFGYREIRKLAP
jgi:hypothetical protein